MTAVVADRYRALRAQASNKIAELHSGKTIRIQVGSATCENAAGAREVWDELQKHIRASGRTDILLQQTGCTGRCSCEPIVGMLIPGQMPIKYEKVTRERAHEIFSRHVLGGEVVRELTLDKDEAGAHRYEFLFCGADRCGRAANKDYARIFSQKLAAAGVQGADVKAHTANCFGLCDPFGTGKSIQVLVRPTNIVYTIGSEEDLDLIIEQHIKGGRIVDHLSRKQEFVGRGFFDLYGDISFFNRQTRLALRNSGVIDPESLDDSLRARGFEALAKCLEKGDPSWVREEVARSLLRGRGGGGYPTGVKWRQTAAEKSDVKYIICNADEGDPGAFMDRSMLEGDPYSVIEGMIIGAYAIGATQGYFYIRAEYPLAVERIERALEHVRARGLLGKDILGSGFDFDIDVRLGAGAFVCGEETALIHSIEGQRGQPRIRPPYPAQSGLWGKPTCINNVETFANVPVVLLYGADWFRQIGTEKSGGTKVFALAGKVQHTGLVEVPMGVTLREIVYDIGGGIKGGKKLKAIQTGGPAGGCIRHDLLDTPVDFDTLSQVGSIMGSGGMIVLDEDDCVVDLAKYFMSFSQNESCGKCTPCREGTKRMLEILEKITEGKGTEEDLERLNRLADLVKKSSLCGLGRAAPNPVLSTLKYFPEEYAAHVGEKKSCPSLKCKGLVHYEITDNCTGCTLCAKRCPASCIDGKRREKHVINQDECVKCGVCFDVCRFDAVARA
jgi:NADH:ubiquinone oxidoreductase subunit F (NADH-binding)/(2Fe-2S) ferredoxin/Pyruvate/2-oxoacid:ferredoxin oxidoreductase delta subunit